LKTVESTSLFLQNDKSDKVYEVDLCEVEDGLFVVNFRYGKRNSNLREGTKTVFPVSYDEAKGIYNQLVQSKFKKGYSFAGQQPDLGVPDPSPLDDSPKPSMTSKTVLRYLKDLKNGTYKRDWSVSRLIWRAGELKLKDAENVVKSYLNSSDFQEQYAAVWTLGRLQSSSSVNEMYSLWQSATSETIKTLLSAALMGFENPHKKGVKFLVEGNLPLLLREAIRSGNVNSIKAGITDFTKNKSKETADLWVNLYLISIDDSSVRALVKEGLQKMSTKTNEFKVVRKTYKLAEFNEDFECLAICAKKLGVNRPNYTSNSWVYVDGRYIDAETEKVKPNSSLSFSTATKAYFNRRTLRRLQKASTDDPKGYIDLATEILLSVDDEVDQQQPFKTYSYDYSDGWQMVEQWYPKYYQFVAYHFILSDNSEHLVIGSKNQSYSYAAGFNPEINSSQKREEYRSQLWDQSPKQVCKLLANAKVTEVNDFALNVFDANPGFKDDLSSAQLASMASSRYENTVNKAVDLIRERYAGQPLPFELILGLMVSEFEMAQNLGKESFQAHVQTGKLTSDDIISVVLLGSAEVLEWLASQPLTNVNLSPIQFSQIGAIVYDPDRYNDDFFKALIQLASRIEVAPMFSDFSAEDIEAFVKSNDPVRQEFGLLLIRLNTKPTHELAAPFLDAFLSSENHVLRAAAIELLADFPDQVLLEKTDLVTQFVFAEHKEVRMSIVPVVKKLIPLSASFSQSLFTSLLAKVCAQEVVDGENEDYLSLLQDCYLEELSQLDRNQVVDLLLSSVDAAQKLGEQQFHQQKLNQQFGLTDWIALKDSDVFSIRAEIQHFYTEHKESVMNDLDESLKILESKWTDLRNWAMTFFLEQSNDLHWTLDQVLQVADSPKEDVQSFARTLISKLFSSKHGKELMVHLSEHPSRSMMLFNSNYLNIYAKDNPPVILQLKQYFKNILYGINLGSASKARVFAFLRQELQKDESVALMTLEILSEVMLTKAIGDKSNCIDLTLEIGELYPEIELPISISPLNPYSHAVQS
jgi:hypothetical protein